MQMEIGRATNDLETQRDIRFRSAPAPTPDGYRSLKLMPNNGGGPLEVKAPHTGPNSKGRLKAALRRFGTMDRPRNRVARKVLIVNALWKAKTPRHEVLLLSSDRAAGVDTVSNGSRGLWELLQVACASATRAPGSRRE